MECLYLVLADCHLHAIFILFHVFDRGLCIKAAAGLADGAGKPCQIFERMEGGLVWIAQRSRLFMGSEWHACLARDRHADLLGRLELLVDDAGICAWHMKEMAIEPPEVAVDAEVLHVAFDAVDGGGLALIPELGRLLATAADQLVEPVIALRRQMRRGAGRHALADRAAVNDHDVLSGLGQLVGDRHAGNA